MYFTDVLVVTEDYLGDWASLYPLLEKLIWCRGGGQEEDGKANRRFPGEEIIRVAQSRLASGLGNKAVQQMILAFVRYVGYVKW